MLDGGSEVLRDVVMATNFWMQFAITGVVGYNYGCILANDTLLGFWGQAIR